MRPSYTAARIARRSAGMPAEIERANLAPTRESRRKATDQTDSAKQDPADDDRAMSAGMPLRALA